MASPSDFAQYAHRSRPALQGIAGSASRRGLAPLAPLAVRLAMPSGAIGVGTMRAVVASSDALRRHLMDPAATPGSAAELTRPRGTLAELMHRYQVASRQCVREWLQDPCSTVWLVEAASGRILDATSEPIPIDGGIEDTAQAVLADVQPLYGLRDRHTRPGIGIPVVIARRDLSRSRRLEALEAHARTAVVVVERGFDARVRSVRVRLFNPDAVDTVRLRGSDLPLAADWTAAVAYLLGRERRPVVPASLDANPSKRASFAGFTPLTPAGPGRSPVVLIEGAGLSPLMMAQVANEIAGDAELRARYTVWLYRYPMTAPLFQTASRLRADLTRFCARLDRSNPQQPAQAVVVAQGPSAVLARALLVDSGETLWNAVFASPPDVAALPTGDRAALESMLRWQRSPRVSRVVAVSLPDNSGALAAGVGERAVQGLLQQPRRIRDMLARLHAATALHVAAPASTARHAEPLQAAVFTAAVAAERALLGLLATPATSAGAMLYEASGGSGPIASLGELDGAPLGPQALRQLLTWLRRPSHPVSG